MFVIKNYFESRNDKIKNWEEARNKWVAENDYNRPEAYERKHPYPAIRWGNVLQTAIPVTGAVIVATLLGLMTYNDVKQPDHPVDTVVYKDNDQCDEFKINDTAQIKYGDYEGAQVRIVGGCGSDYKTEVIKDQTLFGEGSEKSGLTDKRIEKGLVIYVDRSDNLTVTGHQKPEKE